MTLKKLVSMGLLATVATVTAACSSTGNDAAAREEIIPYWLERKLPEGMPAPAPVAKVEPVAAAPAPTGNCANYRPAMGANQNLAEMAFPTGDKRTSAVMVQQVMPKQVRAGANYEYEIHVTNITAGTLQNVVVNGESMSNMNIVSSVPPAGRSSAGNAQWVVGDLASCKTSIIKVTAVAPAVGNASNCLSVSYNNTLCASLEVVQPALALVKTMSPADGLICDPVTVNFEVKNTGSGAATNVVIKDQLPGGMTTMDGKTAIEIPVGTLAAGQSATRSVQVKATQKGRFENDAQAMADGGLTATSGKAAVMLKQPVLALAIKCPTRVFLGRDVCYEVTVNNTGDAPSNNTILSANMPAGATFVRASDGGAPAGAGVSWNIGTVPAGGSKTVTFCVKPGAAGAYAVTATVNGNCANQATANCSTNLEGIPAILVECIDVDDPDEVGTDETYIITVTNQGTAPGTGIKVVATIPAEMSYLSSSGATTGTANGQVVTFAPLPSLAPKAKAEWRVVVKANKPGDVRFRIQVTSDQFTVPIEETESTNLYQ